ncbi:MAG TPA: FixH family protein [Bacteroidia bacterium]|nr:FixH family protein [Bacteroidia bacterium]
MKINWGYRVTLLYIGFVGLISYLMYRSMHEKVDLVTDQYYSEELKYQTRIESKKRNNALQSPVTITLNDQAVTVHFPEDFKQKKLIGSIRLFRPSDSSLDRSYPIQPDAAFNQTILTSELKKGLYHLQIEYQLNGESYYAEKKLVVGAG